MMSPERGQDRRTRLRSNLVVALVAAVLAVSGCVGQASPAPSSPDAATVPSVPPASRATQAPRATPTPAPLPADVGCAAIVAAQQPPYPRATIPPGPDPVIAGPNRAAIAAIEDAAHALDALSSYRMTVDVVGMTVADLQPTPFDIGARGTVSHAGGFAMDALIGTRMREGDGSGAISGGAQYVAGNGYVWGTDNVSQVLEPSSDPSLTESILLLTPEGLAKRVVVPFSGGYRRVGTEQHGGVTTVHYRASAAGTKAYAEAFHFKGAMTADVWIASAGGELVGARIAGTASHKDPSSGRTVDDSVLVAFEVTDPNAAGNVVKLPTLPVADPVRASGPPVDLKLRYRVVPTNGTSPTAADLDGIGVTLRYRLAVPTRPVKVDTVGQDTVDVVICGTTLPDFDRRLMTAPGALTVVPLPVADYGTATSPGGRPLPAVGGTIDPALTPVAPAAGLGLTRAHVDPTTGRRGLAFALGNKGSDLFRTFAAGHPGEFVAIVLDGIVLATLPIEGATANGDFVFTGDYTEAETRLLASWLYRDPLPFELRPVSDVEIPTR